MYIRRRDFFYSFRDSERQSVIQSEIVECIKKGLFYSDCCDKNHAIILVVLVLLSF